MRGRIDPAYKYFCCAKEAVLLDGSVQQQDSDYMQQTVAFLRANTANHEEVPIAAIIVHPEHGIIAKQCNSNISHCDPTAHAEINALREAGAFLNNYRLCGCTIYITLEPCMMCFYALMHARIARIVFSCSDNRVGVLSKSLYLDSHAQHNHHFSWSGGILMSQTQPLLQQFFLQRR